MELELLQKQYVSYSGGDEMELLLTIAVLIVLAYLSFQLAGCLVGIIRLLLTIFIVWLLYTYIVGPWLATI